MSSGSFRFSIKSNIDERNIPLSIVNSQIEIDGGFEGVDSLILLEAKNTVSDNFLIRQLYYPYRLWQNKIHKPIRPIFFSYSNGIFELYEYVFDELNNYNSLCLVKQKKYAFEPEAISFDDILEIFSKIVIVEDLDVPFPQANTFKRVVNLCEILYENNSLSKDDITFQYSFDERQTNYYTDAGRYLGLVQKNTSQGIKLFSLTSLGIQLFKMNIKKRNLTFAKLILQHRPFYLAFCEYIKSGERPSKSKTVEYMKESGIYNVKSDKTFGRRSSTVLKWIDWILDLGRE